MVKPEQQPCAARLRILATTDLHMQVLPFDYVAGKRDRRGSLVQLADQISALRAQSADLTLLVDNGDFLQGNPLADQIAARGLGPDPHPIVQAFGLLGYDAVGLGNHEFNYGLPFLQAALRKAAFPVVCSNVDWQDQPVCAQPFALLDRQIRASDGTLHPIRIGVVSFVPPQITLWDHTRLQDSIRAHDMVDTAKAVVPALRALGADLIVALCHTGIGPLEQSPNMEQATVPIAALDGVDVIVTGHTHEFFPRPGPATGPVIRPETGLIHGKPVIGAGFHGKVLGLVTLDLHRLPRGWAIAGHACRLIPSQPLPPKSPAARAIAAAVRPSHSATLRRIRRKIATTDDVLHSYFSRVVMDLPRQLLGDAMIRHGKRLCPATPLPVLAAVPPFHTGGRGDAQDFIHIPAGPVTERHASAIYPFADTPVVISRSGAQIRDWLEQAVSGYCQIMPGAGRQWLFDPDFAGYLCDTLCGLTYAIDLTQPARHDASGKRRTQAASRIRDLRCNGRHVMPHDQFIVVVASYRAFGGGGYPVTPQTDVLHHSGETVRGLLLRDLAAHQRIATAPARPIWRFAPIAQARAVFASAAAARPFAQAPIDHDMAGSGGFDLFSLTF